MAYSNDLIQIKAGLTNYIGAAISAVPYNGRAKNQIVAGMLMDALLEASQLEKNAPCDPYILIPMFKGVIIFLKQQILVLSQEKNPAYKERADLYQQIISVFEGLIKENTPAAKG